MEVKGVGQRLPRTEAEPKEASHFEEVFDESKKKLEEGQGSRAELSVGVREALAELDSLRSPYIDNNPLFTSLKEWMTGFRKELLENEDKLGDRGAVDTVPDYELRMTLYDCVKKLLREIVRTSDRTLQMNYLQRAYDWFLKRQKQRRQSTRHEISLPTDKLASTSPPKYMPEVPTRQLYEEKMRTLHPEIPPPRDRLARYKYKGLRADSEAARETTAATPEQAEPIQIPSPPLIPMKVGISGGEWAQRPRKQAPITAKSTYLYYEPQHPEEQKMERMWVAKKNQDIAEKRTAEEQEQVVRQWGEAKGKLNESLLRKHENANYGTNFGVRRYRPERGRRLPRLLHQPDSAYKDMYDQNSSGAEEPDASPSNMSPLSKSVQKPRTRKMPVVADLRTSTDSLGQLNKSFQDPSRVIYEKDKHKVDYLRKMYGHLINATDDKMDSAANIFVSGPKGAKTLSLYNQYANRPYTSVYRGRRPTHSVPATHSKSREEYRMQQMQEISRIKEHLAREDVPCSITALQRAVLIPEDYPAAQMTAQNFPRPGSRLLINPFAVKKKKKGKKSKKKGK
jgi:hypothetical protein